MPGVALHAGGRAARAVHRGAPSTRRAATREAALRERTASSNIAVSDGFLVVRPRRFELLTF
jgi:hypothetical protein